MKPNHTCVLLRENMHQVVEMMMMIVVVRLLWTGEISHIFADNNFRDKTQLLFELRGSVHWICDAKNTNEMAVHIVKDGK